MVVLGGGNGIGRQTCHALAQAGAKVVCVDRDETRASAVAREVDGVAHAADVTKRGEVERVFAAARQHGAVRGVVDIVGMPHLGPLANLDDRLWASQFDLVLTHAFLAVQIGGKAIADAGGGTMVFVASMSGLTQIPGQVAYGTAKAALIQLVAGMGLEFGPARVRVNAVAPGFVRTPRLNDRQADSARGAGLTGRDRDRDIVSEFGYVEPRDRTDAARRRGDRGGREPASARGHRSLKPNPRLSARAAPCAPQGETECRHKRAGSWDISATLLNMPE